MAHNYRKTVYSDYGHVFVREGSDQYAFRRLTSGDVLDTPIENVDRPVVFVGDSMANHYVNERSLDKVPDAILSAVRDEGYTIVSGVDGGWKEWNGRPEFSESYLDASEAHVVD